VYGLDGLSDILEYLARFFKAIELGIADSQNKFADKFIE
jgi:hypothetical protein